MLTIINARGLHCCISAVRLHGLSVDELLVVDKWLCGLSVDEQLVVDKWLCACTFACMFSKDASSSILQLSVGSKTT